MPTQQHRPTGLLRATLTLLAGGALAQALPLLLGPWLTRLYSPTDFGVLTHFVAWLSNLVVIATWRYDIEPTATGCRVAETWIDERGALITFIGKVMYGVADRAAHNREGMVATLENLKAAAEA